MKESESAKEREDSPEDGVVGQLAEALAHTCGLAQVLLQQVGEDLQHHLIWQLLLEVLLCWGR